MSNYIELRPRWDTVVIIIVEVFVINNNDSIDENIDT